MKSMCKRSILLVLCLVLTLLVSALPAAAAESTDYVIRDIFGIEVPFDLSLLTTLEEQASKGENDTVIDVRDLANVELFEIIRRTGREDMVCAGIYVLDDAYYYLNYETLGNQHFDADGNFSYRSGEVTLTNAETYHTEIKDALAPLYGLMGIEDPDSGFSIGKNEETERPIYDEHGNVTGFVTEVHGWYSEDLHTILLWIGAVLLGLILPLPFLIIGFTVSRSKKLGYPRYWRILSYIAIAWMVTAAILLVLFALTI